MSTPLQRSNVSFRRQGSSGRIWEDPARGLDLKGGPLTRQQSCLGTDVPRTLARQCSCVPQRNSLHQEKLDIDRFPSHEGTPMAPAVAQTQKPRRSCGLSAMFGPCMRSPAYTATLQRAILQPFKQTHATYEKQKSIPSSLYLSILQMQNYAKEMQRDIVMRC